MGKLSRKELKILKERLITDYNPDNSVISISDASFCENGKLSIDAYEEIKAQARYMSTKEKITIEIPEKRKVSFLPCLKEYISKEILEIDAEIDRQKMIIFWLYFVATFIFIGYNLILDTTIFYEMVFVAFWVCNFNAVEKIIFEIPKLKRKERKLLRLASADLKKIEEDY